ncbi:large conductance mechanosensitive channel protein MscL [Anoxybacillus flavithermus]|uniref:large conductance mechanosensitive channel protein MscL n=1 Tax=Anoxybacillus flavithermus TaxID=33934 RepID=UPI000B49CE77|nr:large conductance mechanosensitive channel protein MscL [Anoxybacillus flavithermus]ASA96525.1 large-conductance mechanosensitive channel [Anoxybacillus flavithermus]MBE2919391.1 large conductance mechanosensitive channel protein MscL [Anoxybacillus flavithermus]MBE2924878.1 large conductance mechanosensitive channel protein MscL [Anoxybacillus flavithermus]MBE2927740.1 large conductance mechanosensitive channel protein MscL [Anoxybacillus flavithermus]MBE2929887.1 large conductance mechano
MWQEFKKFAVRGNVIDLAVGVIIGGAFGKIVSSLVNDIIMPLVGLILGGIDFSSLSWKVGEAEVKYGAFLQTVVDFLVIAFSIFLFVKLLNNLHERMKKQEETKQTAPTMTKEQQLLTEIRDLLKQQKETP